MTSGIEDRRASTRRMMEANRTIRLFEYVEPYLEAGDEPAEAIRKGIHDAAHTFIVCCGHPECLAEAMRVLALEQYDLIRSEIVTIEGGPMGNLREIIAALYQHEQLRGYRYDTVRLIELQSCPHRPGSDPEYYPRVRAIQSWMYSTGPAIDCAAYEWWSAEHEPQWICGYYDNGWHRNYGWKYEPSGGAIERQARRDQREANRHAAEKRRDAKITDRLTNPAHNPVLTGDWARIDALEGATVAFEVKGDNETVRMAVAIPGLNTVLLTLKMDQLSLLASHQPIGVDMTRMEVANGRKVPNGGYFPRVWFERPWEHSDHGMDRPQNPLVEIILPVYDPRTDNTDPIVVRAMRLDVWHAVR